MSVNSIISCGTDILLALFAVYLFFYYFDIFLIRKKRRALTVMGTVVFAAWQIEISNGKILPAYANISITIITVLLVVELIYKGKFWNKCIFAIAFNAIWMLIETISGNILLTYCCEFTDLMFSTWLSATAFHVLSGIICITAVLGYGFGQETGTEVGRMLLAGFILYILPVLSGWTVMWLETIKIRLMGD